MTKVEECTRAEMGVGAAIAAGSHLEKGKRADLVITPNKNTLTIIGLLLAKEDTTILESTNFMKNKQINKTRRLSPKRLVKRVIRPE